MNNAVLKVYNGLGDKMLDIIGFCIICKYMNYSPHIILNNETQWGPYHKNLFIFKGFKFSEETCEYFVNQPHPSTSLSVYRLYMFIKKTSPYLTFEQLSKEYIKLAKEIIQPSDIITSRYPPNLENAYGIHLRKSDKVSDEIICDTHMTTTLQFDNMINTMLDDIEIIILTEEKPIFFICSEDKKYKREIIERILKIKKVVFVTPDYTNEHNYDNFDSVLDMFCLSRCKTIFQSVKYSTFSILSSILGNNKIRNYSYLNKSDKECLIHNWVSIIEINNNKKNYDETYFYYKRNNSQKLDINTNIKQKIILNH